MSKNAASKFTTTDNAAGQKNMKCKRCRKQFYRSPDSRKQYCNPCKAKVRAAQVKAAHDREVERDGGVPGIGQGNNQWGEKNPLWNGGTRTYRDLALGEQGNRCCLCDSSSSVRAHHINGSRSDNNIENLIMLCAACHGGIHAFEDEALGRHKKGTVKKR